MASPHESGSRYHSLTEILCLRWAIHPWIDPAANDEAGWDGSDHPG